MKAVVGVFKSRSDAEVGVAALVPLKIARAKINVLTPEVTDKEIAAVPTMASEQPGMGEAIGAVVGGAMGVAGGAGFAPAVASLLIHGVGPVLGVGILAGTFLGAIGAVGGGAIGTALESATSEGVPENELFIYEDTLRKGCSVVVVMAEDDDVNAVRGALEFAGAETVDRAREMWWLGLRDAEKERYSVDGRIFEQDERDFRSGFEAALWLRFRNRSYEECYQELDVDSRDSAAFRRGNAPSAANKSTHHQDCEQHSHSSSSSVTSLEEIPLDILSSRPSRSGLAAADRRSGAGHATVPTQLNTMYPVTRGSGIG